MTEREARFLREKFGDGCDLAAFEKRLDDGEPLAYILGEWYFYDEVYNVSPSVLIPRPETEHLVEEAIKALKRSGTRRLLDLCTGSGCVAISTVKHTEGAAARAFDISEAALEIAKENAALNGVEDSIVFERLDVLDVDALKNVGRYDVVTSNPPYIRSDVIPTLETVRREPHIALDGGSDGLVFYRAIISAFDDITTEDGCMLFEIGYDQGDALEKLCGDAELECRIIKDYSSNDRVAVIKRKQNDDRKE